MATRKKPARKPTVKRKPVVKRKRATSKGVRTVAKKPRTTRSKPKPRVRVDKDSVGVVTHYFPKVRAAVIKLIKPLSIGDSLRIKGHTTDFKLQVTSMQLDHQSVNRAGKGAEIGLGVTSRVREHDVVLKI